jgi:hypothetical protein
MRKFTSLVPVEPANSDEEYADLASLTKVFRPSGA